MGAATGASIFILHYGMAFPAPWGLLPVVPCAGLIAAGVSGHVKGPAVLRSLPLVYLGTISYSFYLWHLPTNYMLRAYFIEDTAVYKYTALALATLISVLSFHLLERPMRRARFLMTRRERRRLRHRPPIDLKPVKLGWVAVLTVLASILAVLSFAPQGAVPDADPNAARADAALDVSSKAEGGGAAAQRQAERVDQALRQTTFPAFDPPLKKLKNLRIDMEAIGCTGVSKAVLERCRFGDSGASKTAVVLGDSTAVYYMPGIREALVPKGWSVQQFTRLACPAWTLTGSRVVEKKIPGCVEHNRDALDVLRAQRPDLVIMTTGAGAWLSQASLVDLPLEGAELVSAALGKTLKAVKPLAKRVVILESPPGTRDLRRCVTRFSTPNNCKAFPSPDWNVGTKAEAATAARYDVEYVPVRTWFCDGACPAFMGSTPVTSDGAHLTIPFARSLAPVMREALLNKADR
jgi:hypothetical protein